MALGTYNGPEKLVFAIDLGTTMSAVAFAHLRKGTVPDIRMVARWPGQEDAAGECKVPSVVRYDALGNAVQCGAEAIENEGGLDGPLARWFKLWLHPRDMRNASGLAPPALPDHVSLHQVYSDFLRYVFAHAFRFVEETSGPGDAVLQVQYDIVMAIPNGWESTQQTTLRQVVVDAGVLPRGHDAKRLSFVSEAEASVHFAIQYGNIGTWLCKGASFAVLDAGGSTTDTTMYRCVSAAPRLRLEEVTSSECVQAGSAFLDQDAQTLLENKLRDSPFLSPEYISLLVAEFEKKLKRKFDGGDLVINMGPKPIRLAGADVAEIFHRPMSTIIDSVNKLLKRSNVQCHALLMVGGFSESTYLRRFMATSLNVHGVRPVMIAEATKKAAAEGACIWYAKQFVVARAARATYGVRTHLVYKAHLPEHRARQARVFMDGDGRLRVADVFNVLVRKDEIVQNDEAKRFSYYMNLTSIPSNLGAFKCEMLYTDKRDHPAWTADEKGDQFASLRSACFLRADLSGLAGIIQPQRRNYLSAPVYWRIDFEVEVFFGQTTLCASIVWNERGKEKRGPVAVIPNSLT